ncbi:MAG: NAD(P)H-dependent oxidoreductase [Candidatus Pseudobacter hemicellulosilyticus]|uniref:NAD(P)H-dependent oxidoreductase n=1 Tax=Candidatus Pseudobacter hemicellulosilyticus TaxID=3121375 RepID=A0AAJ6BGA9_9BACT|nr:MAG: NAD(P)H-dependent oxidoreductase [Pseudobacter sp.]
MYKLKVISSTVRPGRKGPLVAQWIAEQANATGDFDAEVLDLGEIKLPVFDEAVHPLMRQYEQPHTKEWAARIDEADAFVFVTAEYNYSYPASLRNALEYLHHEWGYKAAGLVSYSMGPFGGVRAINNLKMDLVTLKIMPLAEFVPIPSLGNLLTEEGAFQSSELVDKSVAAMLKQLARWTKGMKSIREDAA